VNEKSRAFGVARHCLIKSQLRESRKVQSCNGLRNATTSNGHLLATDTCRADPALASIIDAWPTLAEAIKAGIVAMVKAAGV